MFDRLRGTGVGALLASASPIENAGCGYDRDLSLFVAYVYDAVWMGAGWK